MPGTVQDLTNSLLTSVDTEGNVQDMTTVLNVVCALENIAITAEDLRVTRLGKLINLIRRKVVDMDRQLAKRLKNLVKQWQQLLQNKLPNGATSTSVTPAHGNRASPVPPTGSAVPTMNSIDAGGPSHYSSHAASPHLPSSSLPSLCTPEDPHVPQHVEPSQSSSSSSHVSPLLPSESDRLQEVNSSSHSLNPHSTSPTPPSSPALTHSSHSSQSPVQPVTVNRTKNRFQIMQKMSSIRTLTPSPSKDALTQSNLTRSSSFEHPPHHHPVPLVNSSSPTPDALSSSSAGTWHRCSPSPPPSSSANIKICVTMDGSNGINDNNSLSLPGSRLGEAEGCWTEFAALQGLDEGTELNGSRDKNNLDIVKFPRKRPRSYSPMSLHSSTPSPRHKHRHRLDKRDEFVVHLPLGKVSLPALRPAPEATSSQGDDVQDLSPPHHAAEKLDSLVVSYRLSLLSRTPCVKSEPRETFFQTNNSSLTSHHPQSLFVPPPSAPPSATPSPRLPSPPISPPISIAHSKNDHHTDSSEAAQSRLTPPKQNGNGHLPSSEAKENKKHSTCTCPSPRNVPPDMCPGIHGCVGRDGHWYEWTDHIHSCGLEVTILPYVYIDF